MKKLLTLCLFTAIALTVKAQERKSEARQEISAILEKAPKVYNADQGLYQRITGFKFTADHILEIYTHQHPVRQGQEDYDLKRGHTKITIDFSKLEFVHPKLKTTNYGYQGIFISSYFGSSGGRYIEVQHTMADDHGNHRADWLSDVSLVSNIVIPIDNVELITLLREYMALCKS